MPIEPKDLYAPALEPSDITPASERSTANLTKAGFVSANPGRDVQRVGSARFLGQDPYMIHHPVWAVTGNLGDSQCYVGVTRKVEAIQAVNSARILRDGLPIRLVHPAYSLGGVGRTAERHRPHALFADRPRGHQRQHRHAPERQRREGSHCRGRL